jgi:hypothetical protein
MRNILLGLLILLSASFIVTPASADRARLKIGRVQDVMNLQEIGAITCFYLEHQKKGKSERIWVPAKRKRKGIFFIEGRRGARLQERCTPYNETVRVHEYVPTELATCTCAPTMTENVVVVGNLDANSTDVVEVDDLMFAASLLGATPAGADGTANTTSFDDLSNAAAFQTVVDVIDSLGDTHTITIYFFKDDDLANSWVASGYVESDDVDIPVVHEVGEPRLLFLSSLRFDMNGNVQNGGMVTAVDIQWNNGASNLQDINFSLIDFTQFAANSNISSIIADGEAPFPCS